MKAEQLKKARKKATQALSQGDLDATTSALAELIALEAGVASHYINLAKAYWMQEDYGRAYAVLGLLHQRVASPSPADIEEVLEILSGRAASDLLLENWIDSCLKLKSQEKISVLAHWLEKAVLKNSQSAVRYLETKPLNLDLMYLLFRYHLRHNNRTGVLSIIKSLTSQYPSSVELALARLCPLVRPFALEEQLEIIRAATEIDSTPYSERHAELQRIKANILHKATLNRDAILNLEYINQTAHRSAETLRLEYFFKHYEDTYTPSHFESIIHSWIGINNQSQIYQKPRRYKIAKISDSKLRLGFISSNFRMHPVGWMTTGLFCELRHNLSDDAEFFIFNNDPQDDFISKTINAVSEGYHYDTSALTTEALVNLINQKNLDYLIDLDGMAMGNRLDAVNEQDSVVIKWIGGLIGSTFLPRVEHLISDRFQTPPSHQQDFTEQLIIFDESYTTYTPPPYKLNINEAPCLTSNIISFGCFNNGVKISDDVINAWASILKRVPKSLLILKDKSFDQNIAKIRISEKFSANGISSDRLKFIGASLHNDHLSMHRLVDICLDPFPYSGGLSTLEAVYMGIPVITRPGRLLAHRHSASHLSNVGHPELVASTTESYIELAIELARDKKQIANYRSLLRNALYNSPLLNHSSFAMEFIKKLATLKEHSQSC